VDDSSITGAMGAKLVAGVGSLRKEVGTKEEDPVFYNLNGIYM
jgi:hypothetical protein